VEALPVISRRSSAPDHRRAAVVVVASLAIALVGLVVWWLLSRDLFVMTEARGYSLYRPPIDPLRFLLLPDLQMGSGRLLGQLQFQLTNVVCGVDAGCFNGVGALEVAIAAALLVGHTWQITGRLAVAVTAAGLWLTSPALLGIAVWQATRFDTLAFVFFVLATMTWWAVLGRRHVGRAGALAFVVGSILLLALAFNSKETTYALIVVLPGIAILRGVAVPGAVRRNLLLAAIPLAYGAWFIAWGLSHMDPLYAARSQGISALEGIASLARAGLGIDGTFMYLAAQGDAERLAPAVATAWLLLGVLLAALAAAALGALILSRRRTAPPSVTPPPAPRRPAERAAAILRAAPAELYLALVASVTLAILARSAAPASYYMPVPVWAVSTLLLLAILRMGAALGSPRTLPVVVTAAWAAVHLLTLAVLLAPGSAYDQLQQASARMREIGATLRGAYPDGRAYGPILWRTLEAPATQFLVLRDPAVARSPDGTYSPGSDIGPYLLGERDWRSRVIHLPTGTLAELAARPAAEREMVVAIDADYRIRLLSFEGTLLVSPAP
jgi:hypothetical protein